MVLISHWVNISSNGHPNSTEVWDLLQLSSQVSSYNSITMEKGRSDFDGQLTFPAPVPRAFECFIDFMKKKKKKKKKKNFVGPAEWCNG